MQKDALNNVHITDEQVLITPDQLKMIGAQHGMTAIYGAIIVAGLFTFIVAAYSAGISGTGTTSTRTS